MKSKAVIFTAPGVVEVKEVDCPDPGDDDVVVRVEQSWISNGTEGSYLRGERSDGDTPFADGDPLPFPVVAGYQKTGIVEWVGSNANGFRVGERVFATIGRVDGMHHWYAGHVSPSVCPKDQVWKIPPSVDPMEICPLVLMQVGFNSGDRPQLEQGDAAVIIGDGLVGHWTAQTLADRGAEVVMVGRHQDRLAKLDQYPGGSTIKVPDADWVEALQDFGLGRIRVGVDTVGSITVLEQLGELLPRFSHLVSAGFYGVDDALRLQPPRYGEHTIHLVSGWTRDRMDKTLRLLERRALRAEHLLTHRFPVSEAPAAWDAITNKSEPVLGVILDWS